MSWIEQLRRRKDDRGLMAALRCSLVEGKRHRAWPALSRLGIEVDDCVAAAVAGLYASHPEEAREGNLGLTCRRIGERRGEAANDDKATPTERRFQQLLASEGWDELQARTMRIVLFAKSQDIPVNYVQLERDMRAWGSSRDQVRERWAIAFWSQYVKPEAEEKGGGQ